MTLKYLPLYLDSLSVLDKIEDDQAGKLFKAIKYYFENGELEKELDFTTDLIITPFISQFERDKKAYAEKCEAKRINGLKGGRPPKKPKKPIGFSENLKNQAVILETEKSKEKEKEKEKEEEEEEEYKKTKAKKDGAFLTSAKPPCDRVKKDFDEIWKFYRQKCKDQEREGCEGGKKEAFEKYKANLKKHKHEEIKQAVENYAELCLIKNTFLKNLSTFLTPSKNQVEEWKDGSENEEVLKEAQKYQNNARGFNNNKNTYGSIGQVRKYQRETPEQLAERLRIFEEEEKAREERWL